MNATRLPSGNVLLCKENITGDLATSVNKLLEVAEKVKDFGIISSLILDKNDKIFWHGGFVIPHTIMPMSYAAGEEYTGQYPGTRPCEVVPFYFCIVHKDLAEKMELPETLGEDIFEDADYCLQAQANGFKVYSTDEVMVRYEGEEADKKTIDSYAQKFSESYDIFKKRWQSIVEKDFKLPVAYHTSLSAPTGFSQAARGYVKALQRAGINVKYQYLRDVPETEPLHNDEEVNAVIENKADMKMPQVVWAQAPYFFKNSGDYKIGHCEFEGEEWPKSWIPYCNMMDEIWVPTKWDRQKAIKAGVNKPLYVIYQGIDTDYFHPAMKPMKFEADQSFKFVVNAAWLHRKNLPALIRTFAQEFTKNEDVCLIVKTMNVGLVKDVKEEIEKINLDPDGGWVYIKEDVLPAEQMGCFYTGADCFVLPTHGEGWGLPIFEALACGIPVITTAYGAPNELLRDENKNPLPGVHLVDYKLVQARDNYEYLIGAKWAEPNLMQLAKHMRNVYDHSKKEKKAALKTSEHIRNTLSWTKCVEPIVERLQDIYENKMK